MTREEFDAQLNADTVAGLVLARSNLKGIRQLAEGYKRPDIAAIIEPLIQAHDVAIIEAEHLGAGPQTEETLS